VKPDIDVGCSSATAHRFRSASATISAVEGRLSGTGDFILPSTRPGCIGDTTRLMAGEELDLQRRRRRPLNYLGLFISRRLTRVTRQ
jgi:hypothetical protein